MATVETAWQKSDGPVRHRSSESKGEPNRMIMPVRKNLFLGVAVLISPLAGCAIGVASGRARVQAFGIR